MTARGGITLSEVDARRAVIPQIRAGYRLAELPLDSSVLRIALTANSFDRSAPACSRVEQLWQWPGQRRSAFW